MFKFLNPLWLVENWLTCHWVGAAISIAGSVIGSMSSDSANSDAASQGNAGLQAGIDAVNKIGDRTRADTQPYRDLGSGATSKLAYLLGITPLNDGSIANGVPSNPAPPTPVDQGAMPELGGRYFLYNSAKQQNKLPAYYQLLKAGALTDNTAKSDKLRLISSTANPDAPTPQNTGPLDISDGKYGSLTKKFDQSDLNNDLVYQNDLQFGLDNGNKALNNRASATGMSDSGQILKALTQFGNDYATTKTQGAYDRNVEDKSNIYNMLMGGTNVGQRAVSQDATTGTNIAQAVSGANAQMGANNAAATLGSNAANVNGINNIANTLGGVNWGQFGSKGGITSGNGTSIPIDYSEFGGSF